jgi:CHAT domain-containing protein
MHSDFILRGGSFAAAEQRPTLRVRIVHGDLRAAGAPVLVGTYDGTPLDGAQEVLDQHLGGALSRRVALGQYPGPVGTCAVFGAGAGSSAVVLGLGDSGDITPGRLATSVTQGVLQLAATLLDAGVEADGVRPVRIVSVLIGTSGVAPLPIQASVTALVTGVRRADRKLRELRQLLVIEALEIVELYEERAIQAVRAAARLSRDLRGDGGSEIAVDTQVLDGCGGRPGLPRPDYNDGAWRTVRVVAAPSQPSQQTAAEPVAQRLVELSFTSVGGAARAEQRVSTGQRALIDKLVAEAINSPFTDRQLWNTLYELLVPNAMKGQRGECEHLMYVVDEDAAALPLEMLATRAHGEDVTPLAVEVGIVRRLETRTFREQVRTATGRRALVIADPPDTGLAPLDGAVHEANAVADVLASRGWEVTRLIRGGTDPVNVVTILNALFAHEHRIVHVAGHGNVSTDPARSGVAIGPGIYLGALEIEKMATTPDLVFLNCCHLAKLGEPLPHRPDQLASSISRQLINNGVRAVVAAGWAVDDGAAAAFATDFYAQLLGGEDLGTAALSARKSIFDYGDAPQRINTWGAYQVYGPPAFRLAEAGAQRSAGTDPVARRELADALVALRWRAHDAVPVAVAPIQGELDQLRTAVPARWLGAAEQATIGDIQAALGNYGEAVDTYQRALAEWGAGASLRTLEQLVNIQAKWAAELTLDAERALGTPLTLDTQGTQADGLAAQLFEDAEQRARALLALGETPERWSLLGSIWRRRAQCAPPQVMAEALTAAVDAYTTADKLHRERTGQVGFYPALNRVALEWLVTQHTAAPFDAEDALRVVRECRECAASHPCPDFWCRVTPADADLVVALVQGSLPAVADAVVGRYTAEFAAGSSRRERIAVVEHLDILARGLPARNELAATRATLLELRTVLETWVPRP